MTTRIKIGVFGAAHGVRGQLCVLSFTDDPKDIFLYPLTDASGKRNFTLKFDGITDRNAAELLRRTELFTDHKLPPKEEGTWYSSELVGLTGMAGDQAYGRLIAVHNFGAGDILEFEMEDGRTEMLPFKKEFIGDIHEKTKTIDVFPPDYLEGRE